MAAGILMVSVGAVGVLSGFAAFATANNRIDVYGDGGQKIGTRDDEGLQVTAGVLMAASGVVLIAGIPLWIIGGKRVPLEGSETTKDPADPSAPEQPQTPAQPPAPPPGPAATLHIGPTGASIAVSF
jgi:hypothetical protein